METTTTCTCTTVEVVRLPDWKGRSAYGVSIRGNIPSVKDEYWTRVGMSAFREIDALAAYWRRFYDLYCDDCLGEETVIRNTWIDLLKTAVPGTEWHVECQAGVLSGRIPEAV